MAKLINKTQNNFTIINNNIIRDKRLGIKERGLLLTLLSLPDNWNFSVAGICSLLPDGKSTINETIKKLENFGYLSRMQLKNNNGQFCGYDWIITDTPFAEKPFAENRITENLTTEKQLTENQAQLNTNESNTYELSTKKSKSYLFSSEEREQIRLDLMESSGIQYLFDEENNDTDKAIFEIMVDIMTSDQEFFSISGNTIPARDLKNRIVNIDYEHIRDIREAISSVSHRIINIKAYILKCLYDAPIITGIKYQNMVNVDMHG